VIARRYLGSETARGLVGCIQLRPHQVEAVGRLRDLLQHGRCALLADEVGLGKTYVAAAISREAKHTLVVAPAALLDMWRRAMVEAGAFPVTLISHEALSRNPRLGTCYDLVIVDEAHHARNPATRRYRELARVCTGARLLLLSATPVHNSERDLRSLFALAHGSRAWGVSLDELLLSVVRRQHRTLGGAEMPVAEPAVWLPLPHDDSVLEAIMNLPPALPPEGGGDAGVLLVHGLARQWTSSEYALSRALTRRRAKALALISALEQGRYPSRSELRSWIHAEDSLQLGFPELLSHAHPDASTLLPVVQAHEAAVAHLLLRLRGPHDADAARAEHLRQLQQRHPGARIVAFTQFADTATGLYRLLRDRGRVAVLTARGAMTAGGPMSRREALARFSPASAGGMSIPPAEEIHLLLTTDLLSEGIDLPDVSVVVHLDLPWTPARLEQRVGRTLRLTSRHRRVMVYCMSPPATAETLTRAEDILRRKLQVAARIVGMAGTILPAVRVAGADVAPTSNEADEAIRSILRRWRTDKDSELPDSTLAAAVRSTVNGWIALAEHENRVSLVVCRNGVMIESADDRVALLAGADREDIPPEAPALAEARGMLGTWLRHRRAREDAAISIAPGARSGTRLLRRIGTIASRAPAHRRGAMSLLALQARSAVLAPRGIAGERVLAELADSGLTDEAWLRAIGAFASVNGDNQDDDPPPAAGRIVALLLLREA